MSSDQIIPQPLPSGKEYRGFELNLGHAGIALLPDEHEFVVNAKTGHFMLVNWDGRLFVADGVFSEAELPFMLALLDGWPSYVPNAKLLHAVLQLPGDQIAQRLDQEHEQTLAALHDLVEHCRPLLRSYGIEIQNVSGQGYKLSRYSKSREVHV
jgi:hypothetical protein